MNKRLLKDNDFAVMLVRIILQASTPENGPALIKRLTTEMPPDVQAKLYEFVSLMICAWAERDDLSGEDAYAIEDCKKICDLMDWSNCLW